MPEQDIDILIAAYLEGELSPEQAERFSRWLTADPANAQYVAKLGLIERGLNQHFLSQTSTDLFAELAEMEANAVTAGPVDITERLRDEAREKKRAKHQRHSRHSASNSATHIASTPTFVIPQAVVWLSLAAVLGFAVWIGMQLTGPEQASPNDPGQIALDEPESQPRDDAPAVDYVAAVRSSVDARWAGGNSAQPTNLASGYSITLTQGLAEIVFDDGAALIVQAPATFEPTGDNAMRMISGKITATIPDSAHGFTVATPGGLITDYGTEFGVIVNHDGQTLAQTFTGRIGLTPIGGDEVDLLTGDAVIAAPSGKVRTVGTHAMNTTDFVRQAEYDAHQSADDSPYHRWLAYSYTLRRDPAMLAYYTFDNRAQAPDLLINRASRTQGRYDGLLGINHDATTAPRWTQGRFPGKEALRFGIIDDDLARAVQIDGLGGRDLGEALTIAVWLRVPPEEMLTGGGTLLSLRDMPDRHMGFQFSIFLERDVFSNQLQFGTGNELAVDHPNENFRYAPYTPAQAGNWALVVAVYEAGRATFYHNGLAVGTAEDVGALAIASPETPLLIGTDPYTPNAQNPRLVEAFMGDIDEVLILERTMSADEIDQMYQAGNPYSH